MRQRGYSIPELMREFGLPKTTVWSHIHAVAILPEYEALWRSKRGGSQTRKRRALEAAQVHASQLLSGKKRFSASLLAMLYWAEGSKRNLVFTNTDAVMVRMFLAAARKCFGSKASSIDVTVRYFTGMDDVLCRRHWADVVGIPAEDIRMYYNDGGTRGKSAFGICRLTFRKGSSILKTIRALIEQIALEEA